MNHYRTQIKYRHGFTLIEILIAVAVIAILASILFLAGSAVISSAHEKSSRVSLSLLQGMLSELDSKTKLAKSPPAWLWYSGSITTVIEGSAGLDFWRKPYSTTVTDVNNPLDAPGSVVEGATITRNESRQILNTQVAMGIILGMPANRAAMEKMSPNSYMIPEATTGDMDAPGSDLVFHTPGDSTEPVQFVAGNKVVVQGARYRYAPTAPPLNTTSLPPSSGWLPDTSPVTPLLLDGWGNPIIFVPGSGLRVRMLNGAKEYTDTVSVKTFIAISPEGKVDYTTNPAQPFVTQVGRPFFASAGPDGDFAKGDDNIYSFQQ